MNNKTIIIYYLFVLAVLALFTWIVFIEGHSGWWFLLAILLTQMIPQERK